MPVAFQGRGQAITIYQATCCNLEQLIVTTEANVKKRGRDNGQRNPLAMATLRPHRCRIRLGLLQTRELTRP